MSMKTETSCVNGTVAGSETIQVYLSYPDRDGRDNRTIGEPPKVLAWGMWHTGYEAYAQPDCGSPTKQPGNPTDR